MNLKRENSGLKYLQEKNKGKRKKQWSWKLFFGTQLLVQSRVTTYRCKAVISGIMSFKIPEQQKEKKRPIYVELKDYGRTLQITEKQPPSCMNHFQNLFSTETKPFI